MPLYCQSCVLPASRPNLVILADGICSACAQTSTALRPAVDWQVRRRQFETLVASIKSKRADWDCVIPVSGGKDSTWQVITCLEYGLRPLCVTWKTPARNSLGQANLDNLISLGVDHIDMQINPKVEKRFVVESFRRIGSTALPMHMALFALPLQIAVRYRIPLVLWGENSAVEYGQADAATGGFSMNRAWLLRYGVTHGTTSRDWASDSLTPGMLAPYRWPEDDELKDAGVTAAFLGHFFPWDPVETYRIAAANGFRAADKPKTGYYAFADVDDDFLISLHHWMKWYKFGFTRLWDNLSLEIRHGRMTRTEAVELIRQHGQEIPHEDIRKLCDWADLPVDAFHAIASGFRNTAIWKQADGVWKIDDFLIRDWDWK